MMNRWKRQATRVINAQLFIPLDRQILRQPLYDFTFKILLTFLTLGSSSLVGLSWPQFPVLAQSIADKKAEADQLLSLGRIQLQENNIEAALQSWQKALSIYRSISDRRHEVYALTNLGVAYQELGNYQKAIELHQEGLTVAQQVNDRLAEFNALYNLAGAYRTLEDYSKTLMFYEQALGVSRTLQDPQEELGILQHLIEVNLFNVRNYQKAQDYVQQAIKIVQDLGDPSREGMLLGYLGLAEEALGNTQNAIDAYEKVLTFLQKTGDTVRESWVLAKLGRSYCALENCQKAVDYLKQSLTLAQQHQNKIIEGQALTYLGNAYSKLSEYSEAIKVLEQALKITRESDSRQEEGQVLKDLGRLYHLIGDNQKSIELLEQSLGIAQELQFRSEEGEILIELGIAYFENNDHVQAIEYYSKSLEIAQELKNRSLEGRALTELGITYNDAGDTQQGTEYLQKALVIMRETGDRLNESVVLGSLALVAQNQDNSIQSLQQQVQIAREMKIPLDEGLALTNLGVTLFKEGSFSEAETKLKEAIQVFAPLRFGLNDQNKVTLLDQIAGAFYFLQKVLVTQEKITEALEVSEQGRARAFIDLLAERVNAADQELSTPLTLNQIQKIAQEKQATLVEYTIIRDEKIVDQEAICQRFNIPPEECKEIQFEFTVKPGGELTYSGKQEWYESELFIWVVKPTGEVAFRRVEIPPFLAEKQTSLWELVFDTRESLGVRGLPLRTLAAVVPRPGSQQNVQLPYQQRLRTLHQLLIEPIADLLPTEATQPVIFIPQGSLFLVPFPALQDKNGKDLIEKHTILTAPSIQTLALTQAQKKPFKNPEVLIIGNPKMPNIPGEENQPPQPLAALPGAEQEAKAIASLFQTEAIIGDQATESLILEKMKTAGIIHFATHGLLDDVRGLGSAIALTPSDSQDGLLTAEEIFNLKLNADLVVLSACDTGRGRITGDGVVGLSRSLIAAGVPSVLVSLWQVPDAPTAELMTEFYQNLQQNQDKAQSLRQAMLTIKEKHPDPRNWAAFTLIGEAN